MEDLEIEWNPLPDQFIGVSDGDLNAHDGEDLAAAVLSRFQSSTKEEHQHLCAAVGPMSQELKDRGIPRTAVAYFAAAASELDRLSRDPSSASNLVTAALLAFLSIALSSLNPAVLRRKQAEVSDTLLRILGFPALPVGGVNAGLKCASHLLVVGEKTNFSSISPLYRVILGFLTDQRPKVRKQSQSCLHVVLQCFQGTPVLASASDDIASMFERFLLLAGGSNDLAPVEGPRGTMEVLYILNALKECLPLMSMKSTNIILKYCITLLAMRQSIVTQSIMGILQALCCSPTSEVAPQVLLDLLCSLASTIGDKEKSADGMASTARLLHVGTKKVYDLNREMCVVKLPIMFRSLGDILASEHEEATYAATEALKGLLCSCVDEKLVQQGVEQINRNPDREIGKSAQTIIEKICATIEGFLGYRYNAVWDMSFQVLSTAFDQLGNNSSHLMAGTIRSLADMQKLPDDDFPYRSQLHECVGSAISALGPEAFLNILPLNFDDDDMSDANVWLLPILKQHIVGARLSYFLQHILHKIKILQQKSHKFEEKGRIFSARSADGLVYALWSLLPAFCNYPVDTSSSFKYLQEVLLTTLKDLYLHASDMHGPDLRGIICTSLQILIRQNSGILPTKSMPDDGKSNPEREAMHRYTPQVAEENLLAIRSFSSNFFEVLSQILENSKDNGGCLQSTIREFASIADKKAVRKFFKATMVRLLRVTKLVNEARQSKDSSSMQIDSSSSGSSLLRDSTTLRAHLLDLAVTLLPGLGKEQCDLLFEAIMPAFQDEEGIIQKKAYKILSIILEERDGFLSSKLDNLLELMIAALPSCHSSAKRHRLDSLYFIIIYISKDSSEQRKRNIIGAFLTEIILALKEVNKKTRNRAYEMLVQIGHACGDDEQGGKKENLQQFFNMIAGGLAGESPYMISAAVKGIARLAYEFSDLLGAAYSLLPSSYLLLQRKNREIVKANLGLMKVLVAKSKADGLQMHLRGMVEGLLKWQDDTKNHFKAKVKLILEMLVKKCGLDAVKSVMPEEHAKLLTNIRKANERKERKSKSEEDQESIHSRSSVSRQSKWNHSRIFSEFGDEDEDNDSEEQEAADAKSIRRTKASSRSVRNREASKNLMDDDPMEQLGAAADPLDLLDRWKTRSALHSSGSHKRKAELEEEAEIDPEGRLVVREGRTRPKKGKINAEMDARSQTSLNQKKRGKTADSGWAYTGSEYRSKKAGGDLKKKDKVDPYAYWPLDRKLLNRRAEHKASARKGMSDVMRFAKRFEGKSASGALALRGVKIKKTNNKKKGSKKSR